MAVRELDSPPSMRVLYPKAVAGAGLSAIRKLPGLGGDQAELPDVELALTDLEVDREHLNDYAHVCGFPLRDVLPPTYPHIVAFPMAMQIMTGSDFPFGVIGLVHIGNRIEQLRPIGVDEPLSVRVRTEDLAEHERGTQFEVAADVEAAGEPVWRSRSTYLHREGNGSSGKGGERPEPPRPKAVWKLPGDLGRRYAEVSGDRNPIHMHGLSARLFGMPGAIAHGMWLKARCLAALESLLPERFEVEVRFKLPVPIPGKISFASWQVDAGRAFAVHDGKNEKPHLAGEVRWRRS
jgi:acyl dehydratase